MSDVQAGQQVGQSLTNDAQFKEHMMQQRLTMAFETLRRAREIRNDAVLMAELRDWIRKARDDAADILDELGEPR